MSDQEWYAFWKYDKYGVFPYFLGGRLIRITDAGRVMVMGYGKASFVPLMIVPLSTGLEIQRELDVLAQNYQMEQGALRINYLSKIRKIIPFKLDIGGSK